MAEDSLRLIKDIPDFGDLSFSYADPKKLAALSDKVVEDLSDIKHATKAQHDLIMLQQQILERQSESNYLKICSALQDSQVKSCESEHLSDQFSNSWEVHKAKSKVYEALSFYTYDLLNQSPEDRDLASRAWRWSKFEKLVPQDLFRHETQLKKKISQMRPRNYRLLKKQGLNYYPKDAGSEEKREIFFNDLKKELLSNAQESQQYIVDLFNLRQQIAKACGFSSYSEYHEARRGKRSFSRLQERTFINEYVKLFSPLREEVNRLREGRLSRNLSTWSDYFLLSRQGQQPLNLTRAEMQEKLQLTLAKVLGNSDHFLLHLINKGYVSFESEVFEELGSSSLLVSIPAAFLALDFDSPFDSVAHTFYAVGEALADISTMLNYHMIGSSSQDAYSKALSGLCFLVLSEEFAEDFYINNAEYAYDLAWTELFLKSFINLAIYEMENFLYSQTEFIDSSDVSRAWRRILAVYLPDLDFKDKALSDLDLLWQYFLSYRTEAYQSLSEVLALVTVLAEQPKRLASSVLSHKLNTYLLTNPGSDIEERLKIGQLSLPYAERSLEAAAFALCDILEL